MRFIKYFFIVQIMFLFFISGLFGQGRLPNTPNTTFPEFDGKDLVDGSTHIFFGEVTKLELLWVQINEGNYFCKKVVIDPKRIIKGEIEEEMEEFVVCTPIGLVGAADYELGEEVVAFCYKQKEGENTYLINTYLEFGKVTIKDGCVVKDGIIANAGTSLEDYIKKIQDLILMKPSNTNEPKDIPTTYDLSQNYPNPFNPTTTIQYSIPKDEYVKLVVYDMTGKVVKELVSGHKSAGTHNIEFNASGYASGIYYYRIEAGAYKSVQKMMLIK